MVGCAAGPPPGITRVVDSPTRTRPNWATVVETPFDDAVWVELDSGSMVPIDAPADVRELLEAGVSVLVDLDQSGEAVPWSTVVAIRAEPVRRPPA